MGKYDVDGAFYRPKHGGERVHAIQRRRGVEWLPRPQGQYHELIEFGEDELFLLRFDGDEGVRVDYDDYVVTHPDGTVQVIKRVDFENAFDFLEGTETAAPELSAELQSKAHRVEPARNTTEEVESAPAPTKPKASAKKKTARKRKPKASAKKD